MAHLHVDSRRFSDDPLVAGRYYDDPKTLKTQSTFSTYYIIAGFITDRISTFSPIANDTVC